MWKSPLFYSLHDDSSRVKQHLDRKIFSLKLIIKPDTRTQITHGLIPEVMFWYHWRSVRSFSSPKIPQQLQPNSGQGSAITHHKLGCSLWANTHPDRGLEHQKPHFRWLAALLRVHSSFWLIHSKQSLARKTLACEARYFSMQARKAWSPISDD